jgi:hypothetical protein
MRRKAKHNAEFGAEHRKERRTQNALGECSVATGQAVHHYHRVDEATCQRYATMLGGTCTWTPADDNISDAAKILSMADEPLGECILETATMVEHHHCISERKCADFAAALAVEPRWTRSDNCPQ